MDPSDAASGSSHSHPLAPLSVVRAALALALSASAFFAGTTLGALAALLGAYALFDANVGALLARRASSYAARRSIALGALGRVAVGPFAIALWDGGELASEEAAALNPIVATFGALACAAHLTIALVGAPASAPAAARPPVPETQTIPLVPAAARS
jgi:hypothetical protein